MEPSKQAPIADVMAAYAGAAVGLAREQFELELDFSDDSVERVEQALSQLSRRSSRGSSKRHAGRAPTKEQLGAMSALWGAYIGEVIRRRHGGEWTLDTGASPGSRIMTLRVGDLQIFPVSKVFMRLTSRPGDNIWIYFQQLLLELRTRRSG